MPYKIMMSIVATVPLIFLIAFVAVPEFFVLQSYPSAEGLALEIGITHRYIMSGMLFMVVCFSFLSRNVEKVDNQKEILGSINSMLNNQSEIPHFLFSGSAGVGKTSAALCLS